MISIWLKILVTALGVLFGIATIAASWIIFRAFKGIYPENAVEPLSLAMGM